MESQAGHALSMSDTVDKLLFPTGDDRTQAGRQRMRIYNALRRNQVETIGELVALSPDEVLRMRCIGETSLQELVGLLAAHGWILSENRPLTLAPEVRETRGHEVPSRSRYARHTVPEGLQLAAWVGRQLDVLVGDSHV